MGVENDLISLDLSRSSSLSILKPCVEHRGKLWVISRDKTRENIRVVPMDSSESVVVRPRHSSICAIPWRFSPFVTSQSFPQVTESGMGLVCAG